jgi:hypothetical protein
LAVFDTQHADELICLWSAVSSFRRGSPVLEQERAAVRMRRVHATTTSPVIKMKAAKFLEECGLWCINQPKG